MNNKKTRANNSYHRLDVKLPVEIYSQLSEIAVKNFNARIHQMSKKPEVTPTLVYLLELGIKTFLDGNDSEKKFNPDNSTDKVPITNEDIEEIVNSAILSHFLKCHDDLVSKTELMALQTKIDELSTLAKNNPDKSTDKVPIVNKEYVNKPIISEECINSPETKNKGKINHFEEVREYIESLPSGEIIKEKKKLAELTGVHSSFFSPSKNTGIKLLQQYFIEVKDNQGNVIHYIKK